MVGFFGYSMRPVMDYDNDGISDLIINQFGTKTIYFYSDFQDITNGKVDIINFSNETNQTFNGAAQYFGSDR